MRCKKRWKSLGASPGYGLGDDKTPPSRTLAGYVLTIEPYAAIDLAQPMINFDWCYGLCIQKLYHRLHFTVGRCWNKSLHLQPLQRCYCECSGSPASACVMRRNYSIMYMQSLHAMNDLITVGRMGNLLCDAPRISSS